MRRSVFEWLDGPPPEVIGQPPDRTCAVTVIVPTYNHESLIADCLDGIVGQQFTQDYRAVVYDDASTDATADVVREYVARFPDRIQAVLHKENLIGRGLRAPWIDTLAAPVTPYVAFCEGDDEWIDEYKLEAQWRFMQRNRWCAISHHDVEITAVEEAQPYARALRRYLRTMRPDRERTPGVALMDGNWIMTCTTMFRASALPGDVIEVIGDRMPQDFILFALATQSGDVGFLPAAMARYRLHGANYWSNVSARERQAFETESLWFLAAHLSGANADRVRDRLLELLGSLPVEQAYSAFARIDDRIGELLDDRAVLLERVRYLEEREIELVRALDPSLLADQG